METRDRPGEGPESRLGSKREDQTRRPIGQKEERKAVISPGFSNASTLTLAGCLRPNGSTAWRGAVDREPALRLDLVARGRPRL